MSKEIWEDIAGYEGLYRISSFGRVKSLLRKANVGGGGCRIVNEKILKNSLNNTGYYRVNLRKNNTKSFLVHRLVGCQFLENTLYKRVINHKNGIKTDNNVDNLEWATDGENLIHSMKILGNRHGRRWIEDTNTGEIYETLNNLISFSGTTYSKSHLSAMLNGHYDNKTTFKYISK